MTHRRINVLVVLSSKLRNRTKFTTNLSSGGSGHLAVVISDKVCDFEPMACTWYPEPDPLPRGLKILWEEGRTKFLYLRYMVFNKSK